MWITSLDGHYSIQDDSPDGRTYLSVHAYDVDSLRAMRNRVVNYAKTNDQSVYVKSGTNEGVMWRGRFWMGTITDGRSSEYPWRMSIPRDLLLNWFVLYADDLNYTNFADEATCVWAETCDQDVYERREIALGAMESSASGLWPRRTAAKGGAEAEEVQRGPDGRPVFRVLEGGEQ